MISNDEKPIADERSNARLRRNRNRVVGRWGKKLADCMRELLKEIAIILHPAIKQPVGTVVFVFSILGLWAALEARRSSLTHITPALTVGPIEYVSGEKSISLTPVIEEITEWLVFNNAAQKFPSSTYLTEEKRRDLETKRAILEERYKSIKFRIPFSLTLKNQGSANTTITELSYGLYGELDSNTTLEIAEVRGQKRKQLVQQGAITTLEAEPLIAEVSLAILYSEWLTYLLHNKQRFQVVEERLSDLVAQLEAKDLPEAERDILRKLGKRVVNKKAPFFFWIEAKGLLGERIKGQVDLYLPSTPLSEQSDQPQFAPVVDAELLKRQEIYNRCDMWILSCAAIGAWGAAIVRARRRLNEALTFAIVMAIVTIVLWSGALLEGFIALGGDVTAWKSRYGGMFGSLNDAFGAFSISEIGNFLACGFFAFNRWSRGRLPERAFVIYAIYILGDFAVNCFLKVEPATYMFLFEAVYDLIGAMLFVIAVPRVHRFVARKVGVGIRTVANLRRRKFHVGA